MFTNKKERLFRMRNRRFDILCQKLSKAAGEPAEPARAALRVNYGISPLDSRRIRLLST